MSYYLMVITASLLHLQISLSASIFEVRVDQVRNNFSVTAEGRCCHNVRNVRRSAAKRGAACEQPCMTYFRVCVNSFVADFDEKTGCDYGHVITGVAGNDSFLATDVVMQFNVEKAWKGNFSLFIELLHDTTGRMGRAKSNQESFNEGALLQRAVLSSNLSVGPGWRSRWLSGDLGHAVALSVRTRCRAHFFGPRCERECVGAPDKHYECDGNGSKICHPGWTGTHCQKIVCSEGCSQQHGYCDQPGTCRCLLGWEGEGCHICSRYPGCAHGTCRQPWDCNCLPGWTGSYCADVSGSAICASESPCRNNATCAERGDTYVCVCRDGFSGRHCERNEHDCSYVPCGNGGVCKRLGDSFQCLCPDDFRGPYCEFSARHCSANACMFGGTCVERATGDYSCVCRDGFTGENCQTQIDECASNPCENGGECVDDLLSFRCLCPAGFAGSRCQRPVDRCELEPCLNNGVCVNLRHSFRCNCPRGFDGDLCERNVDDCSTSPCQRGACIDLVDAFACACDPGFGGRNCSLQLNECASSPCLHRGATCHDLEGGYRCDCPTGYSGSHCQYHFYVTRSAVSSLSWTQWALVLFLGVLLPIVIIVVTVALCCCFRKRKSTPRDDETYDNTRNVRLESPPLNNRSHVAAVCYKVDNDLRNVNSFPEDENFKTDYKKFYARNAPEPTEEVTYHEHSTKHAAAFQMPAAAAAGQANSQKLTNSFFI